MATNGESENSKRIYCNNSRQQTNHVLRGEHSGTYGGGEEEYGFWEQCVYRLWTCAGCDTGVLEDSWTDAGSLDQHGNQVYKSTYHPRRSRVDLSVKWYKQLPENLFHIYSECIHSFNAGLHLLCAGGLRALIEGICQDKKVTGISLEKRIDNLVSHLPKNIVTSLHGFRFMGNEALHELSAPNAEDLRVALDVCEDLLNFLYELDYKAKLLPRKKTNKPQSQASNNGLHQNGDKPPSGEP